MTDIRIETAVGRWTKTYITLTGGSGGSDRVEIAKTKGSKLPLGKKKTSWDGRDCDFEMNRGGTKTIGLQFEYRHTKGVDDEVRTALLDSWANGTPYLFTDLDAPADQVGAIGFEFWGEVMKCDKTSEGDKEVSYSVEIDPVEHYDAGTGLLVPPSQVEIT